MKGILREGSFTGDSKKYVIQGSEMGVCFHRGPAFGGTRRGAFFLGPSYLGEFYGVFKRYAKRPVKGVSLSIGALLGEPDGGSFAWT